MRRIGWRVVLVLLVLGLVLHPEGISCLPSLASSNQAKLETTAQAFSFYQWHVACLLTLRTVCNRRVRNADGASTLPRMRSTHWRAGSSGSRWSNACDQYGSLRCKMIALSTLANWVAWGYNNGVKWYQTSPLYSVVDRMKQVQPPFRCHNI